jgi:serine/threonine protein kinase
MRSRLLSADEVSDLRKRWQAQGGGADDSDRFAGWLVKNQYLTEYQAGLLLRGKADHFFLNEYKLLERVGKGRMAGVYRAVHRLGQTFAVKVLPPSKAKEPKTFARFQREASLAAKLAHPNIVRTFQIGQADDLNYIVMEYLDGETFDEVLSRRGRLPIPEAVRIMHQALSGLGHIHEHDMVHRDLKPGNLMLVGGSGDNSQGATVKILDIGLGRVLFDEDEATPAQPELTTHGDVIGTPDYIAPEQARDSHAADVRSDIYSMGCVLYHALAGQVPFPGNNPVRKMVQHATEAPKPLRSLNPEVPEGLQQAVDKMMAKDPTKRYATPAAAAKALEPFLATARSAARGPENDPSMSSYLEWLKKQTAGSAPMAVAMPVANPKSPRPAPVPAKAPAPQMPEPVSAPSLHVDVEKIDPPAAQKGWKLGTKEWVLLALAAVGVLGCLIGIAVVTIIALRW